MSFANVLREQRELAAVTQKQIAHAVGVDQSRISAYENGAEVPTDIAINIIKYLNSPRLSLALSADRRSEVINVPLPNRVNEDVVNVLDVVMEEAEEVLTAGRELKKMIRNKSSRSDLTDIEYNRMLQLEEQIADLVPCLRMHFVRMAEVFDLDIKRVESRLVLKFKQKKIMN